MKKEELNERNEAADKEEIEEQPPVHHTAQKGSGVVFIFQLVLACLLIAAAIVLKTNFPTEYEETRRRYYVLLNEEISFGNLGRYISDLFQVDDSGNPPDPQEFASFGEITTASPSSGTADPESTDSVPQTEDFPSSDTAAESTEAVPDEPDHIEVEE